MSLKKRHHKKKSISHKLKRLISNLSFGILAVLVFGFLASGVNRLFFNSGFDANYPDLSTLITKTPYEKKTGHKIQVEIRNGCGVSNLARMYTDFLRNEGLDVLDSKNADHFNYSETTILLHRGDINRAMELANILMIDKKNVIDDKNETLFYDLTLIIGEDYITLPSYRKAVLFQPPY
ncbi:MAG: LytR C-terminal domain-containing protein [Candidatus Marinimicrobia bacterium]|nr:LytR C-terminal domain-containing protein [Candidatus Neomarinimicrobiota bacterium]